MLQGLRGVRGRLAVERLELSRGVRRLSVSSSTLERPMRAVLKGVLASDQARLESVHCLDDFEAVSRTLLDQPLYEYLSSGSGSETTLRENRASFGRYALRPRALRPLEGLRTSCSLLSLIHI